MARLSLAALPALAVALALAAWVPVGQAGTAEAPEVTDPADDHTIVGTIPLEGIGQFINADVTAAWVEDAGADLLFTIQLQGAGTPTTTTNYDYTFHLDVDGTAYEASASLGAASPVGSGAIEPGGVATAATNGDSLIVLTVPKDAIGAVAGVSITGLFVEAQGTPVTNPLTVVEDRAPDADFGTDYVVGGGSGGNGTAGDSDGDGLNDTKEVEQFGNVTAQNGTGDPDGDGLNNSAEFEIGTNATMADTDGDGLDDKEDSDPLDPSKPGANGTGNGTGNATEDLDDDGLPDAWEREHFNSTTAQDGEGDPDSDGLENQAEFAQGTDPNDADTDGDGLQDSTDPKPLEAEATGEDRLEMYVGAPMFAAIATLCLFALARK